MERKNLYTVTYFRPTEEEEKKTENASNEGKEVQTPEKSQRVYENEEKTIYSNESESFSKQNLYYSKEKEDSAAPNLQVKEGPKIESFEASRWHKTWLKFLESNEHDDLYFVRGSWVKTCY